MVLAPEFDHEDREDAPFLNSNIDFGAPGSSSDRNAKIAGQPQMRPPANQISIRLKITLFALILAVEVGFAFLEGPMVRIMESIACRQYYIVVDPTKIGVDNQAPEEFCKIAEVQAELAAVKGYHMFFDGLLSMWRCHHDKHIGRDMNSIG